MPCLLLPRQLAHTGARFAPWRSFKHKFTTKKDPDAVVDFYSTEDFLQILGVQPPAADGPPSARATRLRDPDAAPPTPAGVFPIAIHFVLAGVNWDPKAENTSARPSPPPADA